MDRLITMVRFPMGIAVIPLVTALRLLAVPVEFVLGVIALPIAAIFLKRNEIKKSWLRQTPLAIGSKIYVILGPKQELGPAAI